MSEASPVASSQVLEPLFVTNWETIKNQFILFEECFDGGTARGGYAPLTCTSRETSSLITLTCSLSPRHTHLCIASELLRHANFLYRITVSGGSHVAALYMYTNDSPFNIAEMSSYMSIGFPVEPNKQPNGIGLLSNSSQLSQLVRFRNNSELVAEFERQVLSSQPLGPEGVTLQDTS